MKLAYMLTMEVPEGADPESWRRDIEVTLTHRRMPLTSNLEVRFQWMLPAPLGETDA